MGPQDVAFRPNGVSIERCLVGSGVAGSERAIVGTGHSARIGGLQRQQLQRAGWTATEAFKKSEIPCQTGKASIVLGAWIGNSWEQGPCRNEPELLNPSSGRSSNLGPSGGMTCRLYWHITTTTSPCSTCRRRCSRAAWLNTRRRGICSLPTTNPGKPSTFEELQMCVGDTVTFAVAIMRCGQLPVSADHRP
jgi:hypothetical protein